MKKVILVSAMLLIAYMTYGDDIKLAFSKISYEVVQIKEASMQECIIFIIANLIFTIILVVIWSIKRAFLILVDKFVDYVYERIKEKEMSEYIEHQFDNSHRKHVS